ncbi:MAG: ATP-grasp domain-containing protein [Elainellaceae cyanobacterium]
MFPLLFVPTSISPPTSLKTLGALLLLLLALPVNSVVVVISLLWQAVRQGLSPGPIPDHNGQTIMLTGGKMTKALHLARSFHRAGHRVVLVETHKYGLTGHRFSNAIDRFYTVPAPQSNPEGYTQSLLAIAKAEGVDVYVPVCSPVSSYYDSLAKAALSGCCRVFHFDAEVTRILDDKFAFAEQARSLGLSVPKSFKITDPQQVLNFDFSQEQRPYILKSIPYDSVRRLNLTKLPCSTPEETAAFVEGLPISEERPWILQEFVSGQEYCTHSTVKNGELRLHCCCESSAFQVNYEQVEMPQICHWVSHFVQALGLTGQASFDFIQAEDGTPYAIECNPRTHSAITLFDDAAGVADAYLGAAPFSEPLQPSPDSRPTYWLYHELWRLMTAKSLQQFQSRLQVILQGKDAIFDIQDPLPFLMVHHWQIPLLLLDNLRQGSGWVRIDFNIGKLVELGGD